MATDAWKRDGDQQTSVKSYRQSFENKFGAVVAAKRENGQDEELNVVHGGTQYKLDEALNPGAISSQKNFTKSIEKLNESVAN